MRQTAVRLFFSSLLIGFFFALPCQAFDHSHRDWDAVLGRYLTAEGLVKYRSLKTDTASEPKHPFPRYLQEIAGVKKAEYETFTSPQKMAFLINAYNALTFKLILDHYPVKSIKDIGSLFRSPWKKEFFSLLEGDIKKLDPIEHDYLRATFNDARIHAAVNCASLSCPKLQSRAFTADQLSAQLDTAVTQWLRDPSRNHFDNATHTMSLSKIFDWFEKDFVTGYGSVYRFIEKFGTGTATSLARSGAKIKYLPYDWKLNEAPEVAAQ